MNGIQNLCKSSVKSERNNKKNWALKNVTQELNARTSIADVSLMERKCGFFAQHCFTVILPIYDESVLFVMMIERCLRGLLHLHIFLQREVQLDDCPKQDANCSHQDLQHSLSIGGSVSLKHISLCQF